jgi:hypothetical protein
MAIFDYIPVVWISAIHADMRALLNGIGAQGDYRNPDSRDGIKQPN